LKDYAAKLRLLSMAARAAVAAVERPDSLARLRLDAALRALKRNDKQVCGDVIDRLTKKDMDSTGG
jgi:hypothetical protein